MKTYSTPELCQVGGVPEIVLSGGTDILEFPPACMYALNVLDVD